MLIPSAMEIQIQVPWLPSASSPSSGQGHLPARCLCFSRIGDGRTEEDEHEASFAGLWTQQQQEIVDALLRTPPRPFPLHRSPLPARAPPRHRPVGLPAPRQRPPNPTPRPAKDKLFLSRLAAQISNLPSQFHASEVLNGIQHLLEQGSLSVTHRELGHRDLPLRALQALEWQRQFARLWPDERTLCAAIEVLAERGEEEIAWDLLRAYGPFSVSAFEALARGLVAACLLDRALLVKKEAESSGLVLGQGVYAELVLLASRLDKIKEMTMLIQELGSFSELKLGLEHCTSVMAACRKARMYDAVLGLFQWWKQSGFPPNVVMYQIVMTTLSDHGKPRDALAIYWEMKKNGCNLHLSTYAALFKICTQLGDASRALRLHARMRESNFTPTYEMYVNLIEVCRQDGRLGKANEFLEAMKKEVMPVESLDEYAKI